jgi:hypothetical protein
LRASSVCGSGPKVEKTSAKEMTKERAAQAIAWSRCARALPNSESVSFMGEGPYLRLSLQDLRLDPPYMVLGVLDLPLEGKQRIIRRL